MRWRWPVIDESWARKVAARERSQRSDPHDRSTPLRVLEATQLSVVKATEAGTPEGDDARERLRETREMIARLDAEDASGTDPRQ
jgi:hypothetical protein